MSEVLENDQDLVLRIQRGDWDAFESLVERYKRPVIHLVYRILWDESEAEDIAQNVFVQVFKSIHRYQPESKFSSWLFTIARNLSLNELRRRSRKNAVSLDDLGGGEYEPVEWRDKPSQMMTPTESALRDELSEKLELALKDLPENQRTALLLYQNEGLSYEEIAGIMETSLSATKSLIFRARDTLKARVRPFLETGIWMNL